MIGHDVQHRQAVHDELQRQIAEFQAKGGEIEKLGTTPIKLAGPNLYTIYHQEQPK